MVNGGHCMSLTVSGEFREVLRKPLFSAVMFHVEHMSQLKGLNVTFLNWNISLGPKTALLIYGHERTLRPLRINKVRTGYWTPNGESFWGEVTEKSYNKENVMNVENMSQPDQEFWEAEQRLKPKESSSDLTRLRRIEDCARTVVDAKDRSDAEGLAVALEALGMLVR